MTDTRTGGGRYHQDPITGALTKEEPFDQAPAVAELPATNETPVEGESADTDTSGRRNK
jgi:hypothetical protein